jgi:hypothetical protein
MRRTGDTQSPNTSNDQHLPNDEQRRTRVSDQRGSEDGGNRLSEERSFVAEVGEASRYRREAESDAEEQEHEKGKMKRKKNESVTRFAIIHPVELTSSHG